MKISWTVLDWAHVAHTKLTVNFNPTIKVLKELWFCFVLFSVFLYSCIAFPGTVFIYQDKRHFCKTSINFCVPVYFMVLNWKFSVIEVWFSSRVQNNQISVEIGRRIQVNHSFLYRCQNLLASFYWQYFYWQNSKQFCQ